ncbi:ATP-dependent helicase, partial [Agrococcus lahaulensis]
RRRGGRGRSGGEGQPRTTDAVPAPEGRGTHDGGGTEHHDGNAAPARRRRRRSRSGSATPPPAQA